ncbi:DUF4286 family protein [Nocardia sp. alder85J]|uniref:DUF4286 family protein n=1 Tax=Nocardia sp. alder85J TaxID=2862949 RepID=UPI001CD63793|nr:DUF4286 family protein [Nocardia sp. alder85J]MCX4092573.1 hypothetical protein [Nocardia sp. alder85J]
MPKGIMVVQSSPADPAKDAEFNEWYATAHLPELLSVPGFVSARRFRVHRPGAAGRHSYLAVYELEADDLTAPLVALRERNGADRAAGAELLSSDPPPIVTVYELIED